MMMVQFIELAKQHMAYLTTIIHFNQKKKKDKTNSCELKTFKTF